MLRETTYKIESVSQLLFCRCVAADIWGHNFGADQLKGEATSCMS